MTTEQIKARVPPSVWRGYYKFCFERNPWDKAVEAFDWEHRRLNVPKDFARWLEVCGPLSQFDHYTVRNMMGVDFVGRYESLDEDLARVLTKLGVRDIPEVPAATGLEVLDNRASYRDYYDDHLEEIVAKRCRREIELMGYEF